MNQSDVKKLLAVIAARYPNSKVWGETDEQAQLTVKAWHMTLDDVSLGDAQSVLVRWFKTEKWAPDPSEIRMLLMERVNPLPSEGYVWSCRNRYFRGDIAREDFAPHEAVFAYRVFMAIGSPRDLGQMEENKLREAVGFRYREMVKAERTERTASVGELTGPSPLRAIS